MIRMGRDALQRSGAETGGQLFKEWRNILIFLLKAAAGKQTTGPGGNPVKPLGGQCYPDDGRGQLCPAELRLRQQHQITGLAYWLAQADMEHRYRILPVIKMHLVIHGVQVLFLQEIA